MEKGKLFVIEGAGDGMGKSTQLHLLKKRLKNEGDKIFSHHFPSYDTYQGKPVTEYLSGNFGMTNDLSPYFIHMLYAQDRAITWLTDLKERYENGTILLMDRYTTSSLLYQAANVEDKNERKDFIDYICDFEYNKLRIKIPDKIIFLYSSFELITDLMNKRVNNAGVVNDIHEINIDYLKKVYENAMFVADYLKWDMINCELNGKMRTIDEIHEDVYKLVKKDKGDNNDNKR